MINNLFNNFLILSTILFLGCKIKDPLVEGNNNLFTQECLTQFDSLLNKQVFTQVDSMPEFPNGKAGLVKYFLANLKISKNEEYFQAAFKFEFVVDTDGKITGERISGKTEEQYTPIESEALLVLKNMPSWKPGKCNSDIVPVKLILPLKL